MLTLHCITLHGHIASVTISYIYSCSETKKKIIRNVAIDVPPENLDYWMKRNTGTI